MENEAITEEPLTVEITQYCDVNKLEIVQESLNMGQIAPGGDMEGNSRLFLSRVRAVAGGQWPVVSGQYHHTTTVYSLIFLSKSLFKYLFVCFKSQSSNQV